MMRKKAEINGVGIFLVAFVGIIVALVLYQSMGSFIGTATGVTPNVQTQYLLTTPANGASVDLPGQELISVTSVRNRTDDVVISAGNYTIEEKVDSTGVKGIVYTSKTAAYAAKNVNITYSYYEDGYIDDAGGRSLALLIPVMCALAIIVIALVPAMRNGIMDLMRS